MRSLAVQLVRKIRHRGPDWSGIYADDKAILAHERLAIVDIENGAQPLVSACGDLVLAVNGEIYNHQELRKTLRTNHDFKTKSDCEVLLYLYQEQGVSFLSRLNGIFAFVLYDRRHNSFLIARDPIGVIPLYTGKDKEGNFYVASEMKALTSVCQILEEFPPAHYQLATRLQRYFCPDWYKEKSPAVAIDYEPQKLCLALENAVKRQLMCDVPFGLLVSGGLDSAIIAAIAAKFAAKRIEDGSDAWWPRLHSFAIGLDAESPDLQAARVVSSHIGTTHHEFYFTVQEGLDVLDDVIYYLETFDVTTVRASVPMFLMARKIKSMGIKMVLSGEGADEIFGGYLYFHKAPNAEEFHLETLRKIKALHRYDCLRANKTMAAWGIEARVPFLDPDFLTLAMTLNPKDKMVSATKMEKYILRMAFKDYLPAEILWRQKEQFSDGVGYAWIDTLQKYASECVSDDMFGKRNYRFPQKTPETKESYLYREIFTRFFPPSSLACVAHEKSIACSSAHALRWDATFARHADPSGRAIQGVHRRAKR